LGVPHIAQRNPARAISERLRKVDVAINKWTLMLVRALSQAVGKVQRHTILEVPKKLGVGSFNACLETQFNVRQIAMTRKVTGEKH